MPNIRVQIRFFETEDPNARRGIRKDLHGAYSELCFADPYRELWPNGPRERDTQRDEGMRLLRRAWFHLFGTAIPRPIDA